MGVSALVPCVRGAVVIAVLAGAIVGSACASGHGLVWGDRTFTNPIVFRGWLSARGETYAQWAAHHPAGLAILERSPTPEPLGSPVALRPVPSPDHGWPGWVTAALVALSAVLCLGSAFPARVLEEHGLVYLLPARFGLLVAGFALLAVVALASTLN